jgi:hypothetical protein
MSVLELFNRRTKKARLYRYAIVTCSVNKLILQSISYIEDYTSVWIVTQRDNCDVRKDSYQ